MHIPFCVSKCSYCNFAVDTRSSVDVKTRYVDSICNQVRSWSMFIASNSSSTSAAFSSSHLDGIDIGGGTPTALPIHLLEQLLQSLQPLIQQHAQSSSKPHSFLSIETTPSIAALEPDKLRLLRSFGVNRCSVGIQSTDARTLQSMNRSAQASSQPSASMSSSTLGQRALANMRAAGFERISADLIFGLPAQTLEQWRHDLKQVADARPDTITVYDCLYRGKGRAMVQRVPTSWPSPELYARMYDAAYEYLTQQCNYHAPYGSVNFSRHADETGVSSYFEGRLVDNYQYLGLGNYASSMIGNQWFFAPYMVDSWLLAIQQSSSGSSSTSSSLGNPSPSFPVSYGYDLPVEERMAKYLLLSLSFGFLDVARFERAFPSHAFSAYFGAEMEFACQQGWLRFDSASNRFVMTHGSFAHVNKIRALLYSKSCLDWFDARLKEPPAKPQLKPKSEQIPL